MEELRKLREEFRKRNEPDDSYKRKTFQREIFKKYEKALDEGSTGPTWLEKPAVAKLVQGAIHYRDTKEYDLYAYCIMSNHVHIVFEHLEKDFLEDSKKEYPITDILRELKRYSAYESNKILNRTGAFWKPESYDRVIRDEDELENTIRYTLNNPVKAGLIDHWEEWPHTIIANPNLLIHLAELRLGIRPTTILQNL